MLLILSVNCVAQHKATDSLSSRHATASRQAIDSTLVKYYSNSFDSIFLGSSHYIDTSTFTAVDHDMLTRDATIYSTLSNMGHAHKSMRFNNLGAVGFDMTLPSFSAYIKTGKDMNSFVPVLPYSEVRYVMTTGDKEQHLNVKFGRQFAPRFFFSFEYNLDYSPGVFSHSKTDNNNYFWLNGAYSTKNQRYGVTAYYFRNKLDMEENGGIANDSSYINHEESDNSAITTNLTSASNVIKCSGFGFSQYFNLLSRDKRSSNATMTSSSDSLSLQGNDTKMPDIEKTADTLKLETNPSTESDSANIAIDESRKFTLGRISHSFSYQKNQMFFYETTPTAAFYSTFGPLLDSVKSTDTTIVHAIRNDLKWSSLGYKTYNEDIPFYLYAGISHGIYKIKSYDYIEQDVTADRNFTQIGLNGGIVVNLFKSTRITGEADMITIGYQAGDFNVNGQWKQFLGTSAKNIGDLMFDFNLKRQSPSWFEDEYVSNHFSWNNDFNAATSLAFALRYQYKNISVGVKQTSINDYIYFDATAHPAQNDGFVTVREAYGRCHFQFGRMETDGLFSLQQSSSEVIHLPLFLAKLKIAYSQPIFHKAATIQPSVTLQYFTKYHADAYMPALRTFYLQDEVMIGNYPFLDMAFTIKVKRANIFVEYSNMFLLTGDYNGFIAPHYPMRDSKLYFGINWRLFD